MDQYIPNIHLSDVEQTLKRDYEIEQHEEIWSLLKKANINKDYRTILSCLKLANCDLNKLTYFIQLGGEDYRDVLTPAEYPHYSKIMFHIDKLSKVELKKIIDKDKKQYLLWLNK